MVTRSYNHYQPHKGERIRTEERELRYLHLSKESHADFLVANTIMLFPKARAKNQGYSRR